MVLIRWLRFDCRNDFFLFFPWKNLAMTKRIKKLIPTKKIIRAIDTLTISNGTPAPVCMPSPPIFKILNKIADKRIPIADPDPSKETAIPSNPIDSEVV